MSHHPNKYRVKSHHWFEGVLKVTEEVFDTFADAMQHTFSLKDAHSHKIYYHDDLIHVASTTPTDTYA
jgi:hypothetical protein